jgi:hypothetical protein
MSERVVIQLEAISKGVHGKLLQLVHQVYLGITAYVLTSSSTYEHALLVEIYIIPFTLLLFVHLCHC